jgi:hypothetical protein
MSKFFTDLKEVLINAGSQNNINACGYYNALLQNSNMLDEIIESYKINNMYITWHPDDTGDYTDGLILISFRDYRDGNFKYKIQLTSEQSWDGYCECTPETPHYNPKYDCSGYCDWYIPTFSIEKHTDIGHEKFKGYAKDMWELDAQWQEELGIHEDDKTAEQIANINLQIEQLLKRKEALRNK